MAAGRLVHAAGPVPLRGRGFHLSNVITPAISGTTRKENCISSAGTRATRSSSSARRWRLNPKFTEARLGVVRALVLRKEFTEALEELDQAVGYGLAESEAALWKARVFHARAANRLETAGKDLTVKICEQTVTEDVDPAIALVQQQAEKAEKPAVAYTLLAQIYRPEIAGREG